MVCATCGRKSHEVARCYRDIARWWSSRPRDKLSISTPKSAPFTGPRTNTTQIAVTTPLIHANVAALTDADRQGLSGFSDAQWQTRVFQPDKI